MDSGKTCTSVGRPLLSIWFLLSAFILVIAAIGLRPVTKALAEYYRKEPIAIRKPLKEFDVSHLPSFRRGWKIEWHSAPVEDIGTDEYVHISFTRDEFDKGSQRAELFITYYSDPEDKVPHTPDVCSRQAGAVVTKLSTIMFETPQLTPEYPRIKGSLLMFGEETYNVVDIFVFCVEGQFRCGREQVRWVIDKPGNKHIYFSKIEAAVVYSLIESPDNALEICKRLLSEALPVVIEEHFPTKEQLRRR